MNFERKAVDGSDKRVEENVNRDKTHGEASVSKGVVHKKRKVSKHAAGWQGVVGEEMSASRKAGIEFRARRKQIERDLRQKLDECFKENEMLNRSNNQLISEKESLLEARARLLNLIGQVGGGKLSGLAQDNKGTDAEKNAPQVSVVEADSSSSPRGSSPVTPATFTIASENCLETTTQPLSPFTINPTTTTEQNAPQVSVVEADSSSCPRGSSPVTPVAFTIASENCLETTTQPLSPFIINPTTKAIGADVVNANNPTTLVPTFNCFENHCPSTVYGNFLPTQPVLHQWPVAEVRTGTQENWSYPQNNSPFDELLGVLQSMASGQK